MIRLYIIAKTILKRFYKPYVHEVFYSIFGESIQNLYLVFRNYFIYDESTIAYEKIWAYFILKYVKITRVENLKQDTEKYIS